MKLLTIVRTIIADESGATAIEYGLIMALIFLAMIGGVAAFGSEVGNMYNNITEKTGEVMN